MEINFSEMIDFIAEHIELSKEEIQEVLELEEDYLYSKGLIEYDYDDTEICTMCGSVYCSCCGCDCLFEDLEDR